MFSCFSPLRKWAFAVFISAFVLVLPGGRAFASDWVVTYYRLDDNSGSETKLCAANAEAYVEKSVTYIATLNWQGTGPRPKRVKITETSTVSWNAELTQRQSSGLEGGPPPEPHGILTGKGETGLGASSEVVTKVPDPWTTSEHGESVTGTRVTIITLPDTGNAQLPPVTLKAWGKAETGADTTGGAMATTGDYSVSVPNGWAWATATVSVAPSTGWVAGKVD